MSPLRGLRIVYTYDITRPDGRAYALTTRYAGLNPMERRIPIRRQRVWIKTSLKEATSSSGGCCKNSIIFRLYSKHLTSP